MTSLSLRDFLQTGQFGPISLGMHQDQVLSLLGEPHDRGTRVRQNRPTLLVYGNFEFHFDEDAEFRLTTIHADHFQDLHGGDSFALDPWLLRGSLPLTELEAGLAHEGVTFEAMTFPDERVEGVRTQAGVELGFWRESRDAGVPGLCSITFHSSLEPPVLMKQIGITVPADVYEAIRREAVCKNVGITQICSEWVCSEADRLRNK